MSNCLNNLSLISSEIFSKKSLNLAFYDKDVIECVLSLDIIQDKDCEVDTLKEYIYFANYFILNVGDDFYFITTSHINTYYDNMKPLKISDYKVHQRKDKLKQIEQKTKDTESNI